MPFKPASFALTALLLLYISPAYGAPPLPPHPPRGPARISAPPRSAIVLFNGSDASKWTQLDGGPVQWYLDDNLLTVKPGSGNIVTKEKFQDYRLHVEFRIPYMPYAHSQERGNSGVYQDGLYEVQVLDAYNNPTYKYGGCGAIYGEKDPDYNACLPPDEWQFYDITFRAPRFSSNGALLENPRITVIWNGIMVHNDITINGTTTASLPGPMTPTGPIMLQDHGCLVSYRNIWIVPIHNALQRRGE